MRMLRAPGRPDWQEIPPMIAHEFTHGDHMLRLDREYRLPRDWYVFQRSG
jgi:hypothetical protein